ncbi:MAG: CBS domain-containing protein [Candidatus Micrarchaeia archaeon]
MEPLELFVVRIKNARKALGLSQKQLAKLAGVSQSEIARLEKEPNRLNPSYVTLFEIAEAIDNYAGSDSDRLKSKKASDIMHRHISFVRPEESAYMAFTIMHSNDFSQLPVITHKGAPVGTVYQKKLLKIYMDNPSAFKRLKVGDVAEESLPQFDKNTPIIKLKPMLEQWDAVLVTENEKIIGIITVYDLFKALA